MANFKRGKTKRSVRCTLCTPHRWMGNNKGRFKDREEILAKIHERELTSNDDKHQRSSRVHEVRGE